MSTLPQHSPARRLIPVALIGLVLSVYALWDARRPAVSYPELDAQLTALQQQFNRDAGHPRLVMILDPT